MDIIVYNTERSKLDILTEALCLRAAIIMGQHVYAFGTSRIFMFHIEDMRDPSLTVDTKFMLMEHDPELLQLQISPQELRRSMADLWKQRRNSKKLLLYKQMESTVNRIYEEHVTRELRKMERYGMLELAELDDKGVLMVTMAVEEKGEGYVNGYQISDFLQLKVDQPEEPAPLVFALYDKLAELPDDVTKELVHLFDLPNLNLLGNERLMAVRQQLSDAMKQVHDAVVPMPMADTDARYSITTVMSDRLVAAGALLRPMVAENDELKWVRNFARGSNYQVLMGQMDTERLWQHMRNHGLIPDDTWDLLRSLPPETPYPRTMPIMVLKSVGDLSAPTELTEELALYHKRKTLSLD